MLLALGIFASSLPSVSSGPPPGCLAVDVLSPQMSRFRQRGRFSATEILDLEIRVRLPRKLEGEHRLEVRLETPDHQLYQTLSVPIRGVQAEARSASRGRARPTVVSAILPVAGTSIVTSSLYGQWTATAFLDGSASACGPVARFVITE